MSEASVDPEVLMQRYLEDSLTEAEAAELLTLLQKAERGDTDLSQRLLQHLSMDAMLRDSKSALAPELALPPLVLPMSKPRTRARFTLSTLASVAAMAACITLGLNWLLLTEETRAQEDEATTNAVAVLARGVNIEWEGEAHASGSPLTPGWLRLRSGLAQIEFYQGARVTLEGPAEFKLVSSSEAFCSTGRLSAHVPPQAKGFRIDTPRGAIVDLGTDFGLNLNSPSAELHVFKGEVELHASGLPMKPLREGQAITLDPTGRALPASQAAFASLGQMDERTAESQREAFERWLVQSPQWNPDSSLLIRLDFQDRSDTRTLHNHAQHAGNVPAGSIVGCDWTEGRWPGKRALEFRNVSDRVRLIIPGDYPALTLSAWIRVHGLDRAFNSLFMIEGYEDGAVHWQITREGKLRLGIAGRDGKPSRDHDTPPLFTPERFGQWVHLATVIDPKAQQVRHYLNGDQVAAVPIANLFPVRLGVAELGNWNDDGRRDRVAIRHFSGAMDEFMLFSRVLSDKELSQLAQVK